MKQFELTLVRRDLFNNIKFKSVDRIEGDSLLEILSQFQFVLIHVQRKLDEEEIHEIRRANINDDDIPF
jgi:hypothetical protein